jgi:hypothetical protein
MTAVGTARRGDRRTADSGILVGLTRMGFIGCGLLHLAFAWLVVQIVLANTATSGNQSGVLGTLAVRPVPCWS